MGTVVNNAGTGTFGDIAQLTVNETVTPLVVGDAGAALGDLSATVVRAVDTELVIDNALTVLDDILGSATFKVNTVNLGTPKTSTLSADSLMGKFISGTVYIPGVESGSPIAALDMASQLAGDIRYTGGSTTATYWSLYGHSVGFNSLGARVRPTGRSGMYVKRNLNYGFLMGFRETVRYQEHLNLVSISGLAALYPTNVMGPSPRLRSARTLIKFTTANATNSGTITFTFSTGNDPQDYNTVYKSAAYTTTISYTRSSGAFTVTVTYPDATGVAQTATATSTTPSTLAAGLHTIAIETYVTGGQLVVRAGVMDATGATLSSGPLVATTAVTTDVLTPNYSGQFSISAATSGVKDLVVQEDAIGGTAWTSFYNSAYVSTTPTYSNGLTGLHVDTPIAAMSGELWDYLKQVCSSRVVEIAPVGGVIKLSEVRQRVLTLDNAATVSRGISTATVGRNVAIINLNTNSTGAPVIALKAKQVYGVDVGQTNVIDLPEIPLGITYLYNPKAYWDSKQFPNLTWPTGTTVPDPALGTYTVIAKDGLPVDPTQWTYFGGFVTAAINDAGVAQLTLTGPTRAIPGVKGPFNLALYAGSTNYPNLMIAGIGVTSTPSTIIVPTGCDPARSNVDLATTISNVGIGDAKTAYNRVAWAAARASGPLLVLTATVSLLTVKTFGLVAGSIIKYDSAKYRVDSVGIAFGGSATITASKLTSIADYQALGYTDTLATFATRWTGMTLSDFAVRPLYVAPVAAPVIYAVAPVVVTSAPASSAPSFVQILANTGTDGDTSSSFYFSINTLPSAPTMTLETMTPNTSTGTWTVRPTVATVNGSYQDLTWTAPIVFGYFLYRITLSNSSGTVTSASQTFNVSSAG